MSKIALYDCDDAVQDFDEAIKYNPDYIDAYVNRGYALGLMGEHEKAIEFYY